MRSSQEVLLPAPVPLLEPFCNRFLVRFWPLRHLALSNLTIARPERQYLADERTEKPSVTVVVPARNESGNIARIFELLPVMGSATDLIFVEGNSNDDTFAEIERQMKRHPEVDCQLLKQTGKGKGDAVRLGFFAGSRRYPDDPGRRYHSSA